MRRPKLKLKIGFTANSAIVFKIAADSYELPAKE